MEKQKFYLVAADALPEVFLRVAEAKRMLQVGEAATVTLPARWASAAAPSINTRMPYSPSRICTRGISSPFMPC